MVRPPVPSVMPKPLHRRDAVAVEEAEHLGVEVAGGGQAPAQAVADHLADRICRAALGLPVAAASSMHPVADLHPAHGHADQRRWAAPRWNWLSRVSAEGLPAKT